MKLESFLDELEKISAAASDRSLLKDFLGGVDPTGTKTFQYGMEDTDASPDQANLRRGVATVGGLLGGAVVVPTTIGSVVGAAQGIPAGPKGILRGAWQGAYSPFSKLYHGIRTKQLVSNLKKGLVPSKGKIRSAQKTVGRVPVSSAPIIGNLYQFLMPSHKKMIDKRISNKLLQGLSAIGLSGLVGGGSAYLQYGKGRSVGRVMDPQQRAEAAETM